MWIIDLWRFDNGEATHEGRSTADDREAAVDQAEAIDLNEGLGVTIYDQDSSHAAPTPIPGRVTVQGS
jgi:hypothetical protein